MQRDISEINSVRKFMPSNSIITALVYEKTGDNDSNTHITGKLVRPEKWSLKSNLVFNSDDLNFLIFLIEISGPGQIQFLLYGK
jgi:hypothetical protein